MFALFTALALAVAPTPPPTPQPDPAGMGAALKKEREALSAFQWRLATKLTVNDALRLEKTENVHLAPGGALERRVLTFERKPEPPPLPEDDPRARLPRPTPKPDDDERFENAAQALMDLYATLPAERVSEWAKAASLKPPDPDRPGLLRVMGRGLGRPQDDVTLFLDQATGVPKEIEIKTTVDARIREIAFLRISLEAVSEVKRDPPLIVPRHIFLNMTKGSHRVKLEMETSDYRPWP